MKNESNNSTSNHDGDDVSDAGTSESMPVMFAEANHQNKNHPYDHTMDDDDAMTMTSMATILSAKQKQPKKKGKPAKAKLATKAKSTSVLAAAAPPKQQQEQRPVTRKAASTGGGTMFITMNKHEFVKQSVPSPPSEDHGHDDDDDDDDDDHTLGNLSNIIGRVDLQDNNEDEDYVDVDVEGQDIINGIYGHPINDHEEEAKEIKVVGTYSGSNNNKINNKRRMIAFCCSITAFVALLVVGIVFGLYKQQNNKGSSDVPAVPPSDPFSPTASPTFHGQTPSPTTTPYPTNSPTTSPTKTPTASPTINYIDPLMEFLEDNQVTFSSKDPKSPSFMAVQWLAEEANQVDVPLVYDEKLLQRYALIALDFALKRPADKRNSAVKVKALEDFNYFSQAFTIAEKHTDECDWSGIICHNETGRVTEIHFGSSDLSGNIVSEIGLLNELTFLDLSENRIQGPIPEDLYQLSLLEEFYGYKNLLTGTLSSSIDNLTNLTRLHLSHNNLGGPIPEGLKSTDVINPIRYLNLYSNQLTGSIPSNLRLRNLVYLDLGRNNLYGELPYDLGETFVELRGLALDHNNFNGTIPDSYMSVGNGRLELLSLNHNMLTGWVPDNFMLKDKMIEYNLHNNSFDGLGKDTCKLSVFDSGEMVEFTADCDICDCETLCARCKNDVNEKN